MADFPRLSVLDALDASLAAATHLEPKHAATVAAARALAAKIDAWDVIVQWALEDVTDRPGQRPAVPANDNTSLGTYARYLEQLGLTVPAAPKSGARPAADPDPAPALAPDAQSPGARIMQMQQRAAERKAR